MPESTRLFSESQLQKRGETLRGLEVAHRLVSIVFYGMITATVLQFAMRLMVERGALSTNLLTGAVYCIVVAAVCFVLMLLLGMIGKRQGD